MKDIIDKAIEKHGKIIVSKYTNQDTKIEHERNITKTEGGMYILEDLTRDKNEMVYTEEHINTWDFEEVKKWCFETIITQNMSRND